MRLSAAVQHVRHIATSGLPPFIAVPAMVDAIEQVVPSRSRTFIWLDGRGYAHELYEREPIPEALDAFNGQTDALIAAGEPSVIDLVRSPDEYGGWRRLLAHPRWDRSVMKNELFRPYGIGNNLDFLIRDRGRPIGLLAVCREPGSAAFTRAEIGAVLSLRDHFRHAMTTRQPMPPCDVAGEAALAMIAPDGMVVAATVAARVLLARLREPGSPARLGEPMAPRAVREMARRLRAGGESARAPSCDVMTAWGRVRISAELLGPDGVAVVSLRQFRPRALRRIERAAQIELSPRERQVALAMCGEETGEALAGDLGLSTGAYRQVAKRIYARLDVAGRDGVRQLLDS